MVTGEADLRATQLLDQCPLHHLDDLGCLNYCLWISCVGHLARGPAAPAGSSERFAPPPARFSADSWPPWASTIVREIASPIPMPPCLVVKNGSKICFRTSGRIPGPLSETLSSAVFSSTRRVRTLIRRLSVPASASASMAFTTRLRMTCSSWTRSPLTISGSGMRAVFRVTLWAAACARQNADHFAHNFIQVDILRFDCGLGEKSTEPLYHIIRPLIGALDISQN